MEKRVELEVERFDNGMSVRWRDLSEQTDPCNLVALEEDAPKTIGNEIHSDIVQLLSESRGGKKVLVSVCYKVIG